VVRRTGLLLTLAFALIGCGLMEGVGTAEEAVATFRERYNAGTFGEIYDTSTEELRVAEARGEFVATMTSLRAKLGSMRGTARVGFDLRIDSRGTFVALEYETDFENDEGTEEFTWQISDGQARLLSYNVTSKALLR
jgi:hypothetical protein